MRVGGVHGLIALVDMSDYAPAVDYKGDAISEEMGKAENSISSCGGLLRIAQEGKSGADFPSKLLVSLSTVDADAENLRACGFKLGNITLIRLELPRSAGGRGAEIESEDDCSLAAEVTQLDQLAVLVRQCELRRRVADFDRRNGQREQKKERCKRSRDVMA